MDQETPNPVREAAPRAQRLFSRRDAMTLVGATSALWLIGRQLTHAQTILSGLHFPCIVRPEQTEGPYFVDERLQRSDIRSDPASGRVSAGTPLTLTFQIMRLSAGNCQPLPDAQVDVWHCDARGIYSDVADPGFNTRGQQFLRGYQMTDAQGEARFLTIYPGWYPIRTVHIHFKIRLAARGPRYYDFTSQIYFPDELTDRVHTASLYSSMGPRRVRNRQDFIFREEGNQLILEPSLVAGGYTATFPIALQLQ